MTWVGAIAVCAIVVGATGCVGENSSMTPRAGDAPRSSNEQHNDRGGNPGTSSDISHGNGRGGEHKGAGHGR